jgi:hypothetical protein
MRSSVNWQKLAEKRQILPSLDEVSGERNDALHQKEETWRENERIAKQLAEFLRLNENAVKQKDARLLEALSELEFERQARKSAEAEKTDLEMAFNHTRVFVNKVICQLGEACREKTNIAKQLDEVRKEGDYLAFDVESLLISVFAGRQASSQVQVRSSGSKFIEVCQMTSSCKF